MAGDDTHHATPSLLHTLVSQCATNAHWVSRGRVRGQAARGSILHSSVVLYLELRLSEVQGFFAQSSLSSAPHSYPYP